MSGSTPYYSTPGHAQPSIPPKFGEVITPVPPSLGAQYVPASMRHNISISVNPATVNTSRDGFNNTSNASLPNGTIVGGANEGSTPGVNIVPVFDPVTSTSSTLYFRTLVAGTGITLTRDAPVAGDILISATSDGTVTSGENEGGPGATVFDSATSTATTLKFRTLIAGTGIVLAQDSPAAGDIEISAPGAAGGTVTGGANEGTGIAVFDLATSTATTLEFRTLIAGTGITITPNTPATGDITIASSGTSFAPTAAEFFGLAPGDYAATIAIDAVLPFPESGSTTASGITRVGVGGGTFNLAAIGIYLITWQVSVNEAGQLTLWTGITTGTAPVVGGRVANSTAGRATGTSQIVGNTLLTTTFVNTQIGVFNDASPAALTVTPGGGGMGTATQSASITIVRIA